MIRAPVIHNNNITNNHYTYDNTIQLVYPTCSCFNYDKRIS